MERYAEIAVNASIGPGRTLTYRIPDGLHLALGHVVWVPLASRLTTGVVFAISDTTQIVGVRPVFGILDTAFNVPPVQLALARWLSQETRASLYQTVALMLPLDYRRRVRTLIRPTLPTGSSKVFEDSVETLLVFNRLQREGAIDQILLEGMGGGKKAIQRLLRAGLVTREWHWERPKVSAQYSETLHLAVSRQELTLRINNLSKNAQQQRRLLEYLAKLPEDFNYQTKQARQEFGSSPLKALELKGLVTIVRKRRFRDPVDEQPRTQDRVTNLTAAQQIAVDAVIETQNGPQPGQSFLLEGVTGSGKTEVYLRAIANCIAKGRRAIYLVPEISLTPQLTQRLQSRFPGQVAVLHSGLTIGQQYDSWWRIFEGKFSVVLGSRSAIFAPQPNLGLIVLDEEHEWTYKQQEPAPRYHARAVAHKLMELVNATVIIGSATPDVATYYGYLSRGQRILKLPERLRSGSDGKALAIPLAEVQVVDMRKELREGSRSIFSRPLHDALSSTIRRGEQVILYLNRRGMAGIVQCRDCGHVLRCRRCNISLTYHRENERLLCHACGSRLRPLRRCPSCSSYRIRYLGLGTQRVVQEVERVYGARVLRWDRDSVQDSRGHQELMDQFSRGEAQVLVGTQMIAKGLHLPRVTLVGAMLADLGLYLPDFQAGERAFQLLCQVVGRAGRDEIPGQAIIQTYSPHHYAIRAAKHQNYSSFFEEEIGFRRQHLYPPFSRFARLTYQHTSKAFAQRQALDFGRKLRERLRATGLVEVGMFGPVPPYIERLRGRYRWQILLRVPHSAAVNVVDFLDTVEIPSGWQVDLDPVGLI